MELFKRMHLPIKKHAKRVRKLVEAAGIEVQLATGPEWLPTMQSLRVTARADLQAQPTMPQAPRQQTAMKTIAAMQIDRKQAGKNVLLHFIAPARLLQSVQAHPLQLTAQPAAQHASFATATATVLSSSAYPAGILDEVLLSW